MTKPLPLLLPPSAAVTAGVPEVLTMRLADRGLPQTFLRLRHLSSDPPGATPSHKRAFRSLVMGRSGQ